MTTWGFAARISGGNVRAAQIQGLAVGPLIVGFTALAGGFAGLAGMIEVAAVQGNANASLASGYGYTGILIAFLARFNPLAIMPMAILLGGLGAAGGLLQRRMGLPDATILVLQGLIFVSILASMCRKRSSPGRNGTASESPNASPRSPSAQTGSRHCRSCNSCASGNRPASVSCVSTCS